MYRVPVPERILNMQLLKIRTHISTGTVQYEPYPIPVVILCFISTDSTGAGLQYCFIDTGPQSVFFTCKLQSVCC